MGVVFAVELLFGVVLVVAIGLLTMLDLLIRYPLYPAPFLEDDDCVDLDEDEKHLLLAEVEALPVACRTVVLLYYYEDLTYRELAEALGVSPATINARLTRARALLRMRLTKNTIR